MNKTKNPTSAPACAPQSKRYDEAFKREAVEHWLRGGKSGSVIAKELGVSAPTLKQWKRRYGGQAVPGHPSMEEENRALKAELARVREQRDILKKIVGHPLRDADARYGRIEAMKAAHPVAALCAALQVSRSGYYRWQQAAPSARAAEDARISAEIHTVHRESRGTYGSPRVMRELRRRGHAHSRKRVARLMKAKDLRGSQPRRFVPQTTQSGHAEPISPNPLAEAPKPIGRD